MSNKPENSLAMSMISVWKDWRTSLDNVELLIT